MIEKDWNVNDIADLTGKVVIVTGGNSGLGYENVKLLSSKGATVVMACRSLEKGKKAFDEIRKTVKNPSIDVMELDLSSLESIKNFSDEYRQKYRRLDILINNAGIMTVPYHKTEDGFESQLGVNHLGHFALTGRLFDIIKTTKGSRVVNISSNAHKSGKIDFDDLMFENNNEYTPFKAYSNSKLANLLFTYELQRKVDQSGLDVKVLAAHPGFAQTNLMRYLEDKIWFKIFRGLIMKMTQSQYDGSLPGLRAATDQHAKGGQYYGPSGKREMKGSPIEVQSSEDSKNLADAKTQWKVSEKLTGIDFAV